MTQTDHPISSRTSQQTASAYAEAGVDVDANDRLIPRYRELAREAARPEQLGSVGAFSGLFDLSAYERPVLAASTDGVGTKVMIASLAGRLEDVGRDLVNHCINDILCAGAAPLFFLDYLAAHELSEDDKVAVVSGVAAACRESGVALLGGETADMPDLYPSGHFDLAGTIVGVLERGREVTGERIVPGDVVLGLPSNGLHTNGYSLARSVFGLRPQDGSWTERVSRVERVEPALGESLAEALLRPHRSYWPRLRDSLDLAKGIAHITGGGIAGNLERVLPRGLNARLDSEAWTAAWRLPPIFDLIARQGSISAAEMYRVFNMGVGMAIVVTAADAASLLSRIPEAARIGEIESGDSSESGRVAIMTSDGEIE
ncbi:MAG: phosphoribosylformylglycinamidine cyclo-ligase [Chloroflexi bacterium]|nr:phosphoribosylformylglycinamidine cyclo-ligase [Chloroflexota bacterium]MYF22594.1 phosphoribosylformylglycinamidine cyclo-ligase [Chloroflexota bacterium]